MKKLLILISLFMLSSCVSDSDPRDVDLLNCKLVENASEGFLYSCGFEQEPGVKKIEHPEITIQ